MSGDGRGAQTSYGRGPPPTHFLREGFIVLWSIVINPDLFPFLSKSPFSVPSRAVNVFVLACNVTYRHLIHASLSSADRASTTKTHAIKIQLQV